MRFTNYIVSIFVLFCFGNLAAAQTVGLERDRHKQILSMVKDDVKKNYYDPTFKGKDIEAKYKTAGDKIGNATSIGQMDGIIAQFFVDFDDSHLFFIPPGRTHKVAYGFDFAMVGDKCFVYKVDEQSDAAKKGLQSGDELYSIEGYEPTRENLWKMRYTYFSLKPKGGLSVVAIKPDGKTVDYAINAKVTAGKQVVDLTGESDGGFDVNEYERDSENQYRKETRQYLFDKLDGIFIWKMPAFSLEPGSVDEIMGRARKFPSMIVDLRGNSGGRVDMLLRLIGYIFPEDVKVADEKRRKETKEVIAKTRGKDAFAGKIVVLIDSRSASASEVFSKVLQLEKRGQIIGDRSSGAVMESQFFQRELGMDSIIFFGTSVTIADLIMKDGRSLEKVGVTPDVLLISSGSDMALKRDIVLAKAIESLGVKITPEAAGAIFPIDNGN